MCPNTDRTRDVQEFINLNTSAVLKMEGDSRVGWSMLWGKRPTTELHGQTTYIR